MILRYEQQRVLLNNRSIKDWFDDHSIIPIQYCSFMKRGYSIGMDIITALAYAKVKDIELFELNYRRQGLKYTHDNVNLTPQQITSITIGWLSTQYLGYHELLEPELLQLGKDAWLQAIR